MKKIMFLVAFVFSGSLFANEYLSNYLSVFFNAKTNKNLKNIDCKSDYTCMLSFKDKNTTININLYFKKNITTLLNKKDFENYKKYKKTKDAKVNVVEKKLIDNLKQAEAKDLKVPADNSNVFEVKNILVNLNEKKFEDNDSFTYMMKNIKSIKLENLKATEDGKDVFIADLMHMNINLPKVIANNPKTATLDDLLGSIKVDVKNMRYGKEVQSAFGMIVEDTNASSKEDKDDVVNFVEKKAFLGQDKTNISEILSGLNFLKEWEEDYIKNVGGLDGSFVIKSVKNGKSINLQVVYKSIDKLINQDFLLSFKIDEPAQMYNGIKQNPQMATMFLMQGAYYLDELKFSATGYKKMFKLIKDVIKANKKDYGAYSMFFKKIASSLNKVALVDGKAYLTKKETNKAKAIVKYFEKNADLENYDIQDKYFLTIKNDKNITFNNSMTQIVKTMHMNKMLADTNTTKIDDKSREGFAFSKNVIDIILYFEDNYKVNY